MKNFKLFLLALFLSLPLYSFETQAAPSDCIQQAADGQVVCTKAQETWSTVYGGTESVTFEQMVEKARAVVCANSIAQFCIIKDFPGPIGSIACDYSNCDVYTRKDTDNKAGVVAIASGPYVNRYNEVSFIIQGGPAYHFFTCPANHTVIPQVNGYYIGLCKPTNSSQITDVSCPFGNKCESVKGQGKVEVAGNIDAGSGNRYEIETDYEYQSTYPLTFTRIYNAKPNKWNHEYDRKVSYMTMNTGDFLIVERPNGEKLSFKQVNNIWQPSRPNYLFKLVSITNNTIVIKNDIDEIETYESNSQGQIVNSENKFSLKTIQKPGGGIFELSYNSVTKNLSSVKDPFNRTLTLNYTATPSNCTDKTVPYLLSSITDTDNVTTQYGYDNLCRLNKVTHPDNTTTQYAYDVNNYALSKTTNQLDNVVQMTGNFYTNAKAGVVASYSNNSATGNINGIGMTYTATTTTLKDARNNTVVMNVGNNNRATGFSTYCSWCSGIQGSDIQYNANGFISQVTDYKGNISQYEWDLDRNLLLSVKEAVGTPLERIRTTTWHSDWRLPTTIVETVSGGTKTSTMMYNQFGRLTNRFVSAPKNDGSGLMEDRIWTYEYDTQGQLIEIKNPNFSVDNNDKTIITYDNGNVSSITNGLAQTISISDYDSYGNSRIMDMADGTRVNMEYNNVGDMTKVIRHNNDQSQSYTIEMTYNAARLVERIISPAGHYKKFIYDASQRLTSVEEYTSADVLLGKMVFTLDAMSNITKTQVFNATNTEIRLKTAEYDTKNRLWKDITSLNKISLTTYDANSNVQQLTDANNRNIVFNYDALDRLTSQTNRDSGVINYGYNPDDTLASIQDPKGLFTNYTYNGFGELIKTISPDSGTQTNSRDFNGNIFQSVDAKNQITNYTYDALNRVTNIEYPSYTTKNVSLTYDCDMISTGKLCSATDSSGVTTFTYDSFGRLASKNITNTTFPHSINKTTQYEYNQFNELSKITYPSGMVLNYTYLNGKQNTLSYTIAGVTTPIINNANYEPFNSRLTSYTLNNNVTYTRVFNKDGLISNYSINPNIGAFNRILLFNNTNTIARLDRMLLIGNGYSYNANDILTNANVERSPPAPVIDFYTYNINTSEDRTKLTQTNTPISDYLYSDNNHQLQSTVSNTYTYDANGSVVTENNKNYTYDVRNRMAEFSDGTNSVEYKINFQGQRVYKNINNTETTWFLYNENGDLIAEYDNQNNLKIEYIWFNTMLVAIRKDNTIYNVFNDHLQTPRLITNATNKVIWKWDNIDPYGNNLPVSATNFEFNLRFPGQYFDKESNLHYNYFRDYNPKIGRYMQSDPIGLAGGINTYGYANGNPLSFVDKLGLDGYNAFKNLIGEDNHFEGGESILNRSGKNPNIYSYISHGGWDENKIPIINGNQGQFTPQEFAEEFVHSAYWKRRIKENKSIIIELYSCNTGNDKYGDSFGKQLSNLLKEEMVKLGIKSEVYVLAPNGFLVNRAGEEGIIPYIFKDGFLSFFTHWRVYKNGLEEKKSRYYLYKENNVLYQR